MSGTAKKVRLCDAIARISGLNWNVAERSASHNAPPLRVVQQVRDLLRVVHQLEEAREPGRRTHQRTIRARSCKPAYRVSSFKA